MKNIAFTGSFDPITKGHLWVAQEALELADKLILIIATNPAKKYYFTESERVLMIKESLKEYGIENKVDVVVVRNEYVSQVALDYDCKYLIRGLRSSIDFDYEAMIQKANTEVLDGAKTIFVMPPRDLESISSSFIKGLIGPVGWHWKIKNFVSKGVYDALIIKYLKESISKYTNLKLDENGLNNLMSEMVKHYTKNRCYHGLDHIVHCYQELEWAIVNFNLTPDIYNNVAIGILAHDIFYNEKNIEKTDEELSAIWLDNYLDSINFENKTSVNLVLSTAHLSGKYELKTEQEKLMSSIDLAILAQKHDEYKWYANGIRKEYSFVDDKTFNYGRIQALEKLSSGKIYHSVCFSKYEQKALNNINKEINYLKTIINND